MNILVDFSILNRLQYIILNGTTGAHSRTYMIQVMSETTINH